MRGFGALQGFLGKWEKKGETNDVGIVFTVSMYPLSRCMVLHSDL